MWTSVLSPCDNSSPSSRSKHSATLLGGHVYLLGGRNGNLPLKDMWRYSLAESRWDKLQPSGDTPPCLQEHTAVAYRENIYVFGGELGFSAGAETPLWIYNVKGNAWRKVKVQKGVAVPGGRRGHTAMVHRGSMLVYGGYQDLRGSSNELWAFHFATESWHLLSSSKTGRPCDLPPARHKHSAVLHDDTVWVYGGMTDLHERADLWKWDTVSKTWTNIKAKPCPGPLHSHAACKLPSSMLIFGGERDGHPTNELWRFHFATSSWERLNIQGLRPQPCAEGVALAVSELQLLDTPSPEMELVVTLDSTTTTTATTTTARQVVRPRGGGSVDRATNPRHSSYHPNNRISPCEKKYVFRPTNVNYVDGSVAGRGDDSNARRTQQMNGTAQTPGANTSFLKEITKLSQMNLSRLSHHNCSYSVLTSSKEDSTSTESLLNAALGDKGTGGVKREEGKDEGKKLVKSQSANVISRRRLLSAASPDTPNPVSILRNHNGYRNNGILRTPTERIPREMASVPNFGEISTLPTPVLTPIEITRLVFLESDDDVDNDDLFDDVERHDIVHITEQPFSILHQQYQPNNKRSDSYNSHLVSHGGGTDDYNTVYQNVDLPKSASVRFRKENSVVEFEDYDDVSTSDYASIEGNMNGITSASNYCMSKRSPESPYSNYPDDNHHGGRVNRKMGRRDGPFGFSNPNYLGPDINSILGGQRKTWHVTTPSDIDKFTMRQQSFARVLNSPPDSLLEDVHGRSISRQFYQEEQIELQNMNAPMSGGVASPGQQPPARCSPHETSPRVVPHFLALSGTHQPMGVEKQKKSRARSASRLEKQHSVGQEATEASSFSVEPPVPLYVFVIGGKDQGKVTTTYKRPVSVWRLQLASNVF